MRESGVRVAIVDFGLGNIHNVKRACAHVGIGASLTTNVAEVLAADAVILPGVGAMPEAMRALQATGLDDAIRRVASDGKPLLGVCLGLQLLMTSGTEFSDHEGLGMLPGRVERFPRRTSDGGVLRVPHIGWTSIYPERQNGWQETLLSSTPAGTSMYFVHSYHAIPDDPGIVLAHARHTGIQFVAAVSSGNIFACQFHPERSGPDGLRIYRQFAARLGTPAVEMGT